VKFSKRAQNDFDVAIGRYVILPDHLHLFVALPHDLKLGDWVGTLKRVVARSVEATGSSDPIWQRGFFDHLLRSSESYAENGTTYAKIPFERDWSLMPKTGHTAVKSWIFITTDAVDASLCEVRR
jgi:transposase IS200 family protein